MTQINILQENRNEFNDLIVDLNRDLRGTKFKLTQASLFELLLKHGKNGVFDEIKKIKQNLS